MQLYETHIPVADTRISEAFYRDVVGLPLAHREPKRDIVFLWTDEKLRGMLGLWGAATGFGRVNGEPVKSHFAFAVSLDGLHAAVTRLAACGIETTQFGGEVSREPSVIGWMPSAQIYFSDPDGHSLEFIALLPDAPDPAFVGPLSAWNAR
jgi:lactoylglutathione lyase